MKRLPKRLAMVLLAAAAMVPTVGGTQAAETGERLVATSTTALSITGNILLAPDKVTFQGGATLPLTLERRAPGFKDSGETVAATLYRVSAPADPVLKNGNRVCGAPSKAQPITFVAVWHTEKLDGDKDPRELAFFSGKAVPTGTSGAGFCGTFNYDLP